MDCKTCQLKQRQFYCEGCIQTHLRDFRHSTHLFAIDRDEHVSKASKALESVVHGRLSRATVAEYQSRVEEVLIGLTRLRRENDKKRDRLRSLREQLASRRRTLSAVKLVPHSAQSLNSNFALREAQELTSMSTSISRARSGLVQELVEVFNVVEVGGRPPIGGKAGSKGEWTIGDLILPVPGDIRRYPPDHINAVLTHTIHFLSLLTFYLGIKLPFEITWTGGKLGVGQPWIGAIKGSESGGWAKSYNKHPLHLSSSLTSPSQRPSSPSLRLPSESYIDDDPTQSSSSFTTAFAMLLYNVCYLAYTQSVEILLSQAGDVLSNLWSVCCSAELGRRSHETTPFLPPPTPPSFHLDFAQLLQATTANPARRARSSKSRRSSSGSAAVLASRPVRTERIEEVDEEGWDLIDDEMLG